MVDKSESDDVDTSTKANRRLKLDEMTAQDFYFDTCAHWSTHLETIGDSKRLDLLKRMFLKKDSQGNKLFAGKSILDLSVGCGLVAMLAVQLGDAKQVVAIDRSNIIDAAREIFRENKLLGTVHHGSQDAENKGNDPQNAAKRHVRSRIDCIKLKTDFEFDAQIVRLGMKKLRFDVIMCSRLLFSTTSETDAFDTALLRSVIVARDRFLKPDGVLLPSRLTYHVVGVENVVYKEEKVDWWKCVYGFDMSAVQTAILRNVMLRSVEAAQAVTRSQPLHTINFHTAKKEQVEHFDACFELKMRRFAYVNALALFTEVVSVVPEPEAVSTASPIPGLTVIVNANGCNDTASQKTDACDKQQSVQVEMPPTVGHSPSSSDSPDEVANKRVAVADGSVPSVALKQRNDEKQAKAASCACLNAAAPKQRQKRFRNRKCNGFSCSASDSCALPTEAADRLTVHEVRWSGEPGNPFGLRQSVFFLQNRNNSRGCPFVVAQASQTVSGRFTMNNNEAHVPLTPNGVSVACQTDAMFDATASCFDGQQLELVQRPICLTFTVLVWFGDRVHVPLRCVSTQTPLASATPTTMGGGGSYRNRFESFREYEMPLSFVFETHCNSVSWEQLPDYYFDSYANFRVHEVMLRDVTRTMTYRQAICRNAHLFTDKVVLDVGCGTGILSMFAAQTDAKHVIGVDKSNIIEYARQIVRNNRLGHRVTLVKSRAEELQLPTELLNSDGKVDILVSEWMGYCLFYEAMLTSVITARDKWLDRGGHMMPDRAELHICGVKDAKNWQHYVQDWKDVHGYNMNYLGAMASRTVMVHAVGGDQLVTNSCLLRELDLRTVKADEIPFTSMFALQAQKRDTLHAFCVWFTADFSRLDWSSTLDTSPHCAATHWQHTVFYVEDDRGEPLNVDEGELIRGVFTMVPNARNSRDLDFLIVFDYRGTQISKCFRL